jgi:endonuclease/exonuclease/phosphatase family metal-dependent hydrolase
MKLFPCIVVSLVIVTAIGESILHAQTIQVGNEVVFVNRLQSDGSDRGIPLHPAAGDNSISDRLASGSTAIVLQLGPANLSNWLEVRSGTVSGWVITRHIAEVHSAPTPQTPRYVIGCWNLEHFHEGATRGFPENSPTLPSRTPTQIGEIAQTIRNDLNAKLLVLNEINGFDGTDADGDPIAVSNEMNSMTNQLASGWNYVLARSGDSQRIAILYDSTAVRINDVVEFTVGPRRVQDKDIFDRDPLAAHVTFLQNGQPRNDLIVVGVHLASGQDKNRNHDAAMQLLLTLLETSRQAGELGGASETDIVIMGDYNANAFLPPAEQFFIDMDDSTGRWDVLADNNYPATRLSGNPLQQRNSQIDYIIASRFIAGHSGLSGDEITATTATVHAELIAAQGGANNFRRDLSDHLPVTVTVRVANDTD